MNRPLSQTAFMQGHLQLLYILKSSHWLIVLWGPSFSVFWQISAVRLFHLQRHDGKGWVWRECVSVCVHIGYTPASVWQSEEETSPVAFIANLSCQHFLYLFHRIFSLTEQSLGRELQWFISSSNIHKLSHFLLYEYSRWYFCEYINTQGNVWTLSFCCLLNEQFEASRVNKMYLSNKKCL